MFPAERTLQRTAALLAGEPSTVATSAPRACTASIKHDRTVTPSTKNRTRAAHTVFATEVCTSEAQLGAQEIRKGWPRLRVTCAMNAVYPEFNAFGGTHPDRAYHRVKTL
jgi:hypothetical protein